MPVVRAYEIVCEQAVGKQHVSAGLFIVTRGVGQVTKTRQFVWILIFSYAIPRNLCVFLFKNAAKTFNYKTLKHQ